MQRLAAASGLIFVALIILSIIFSGEETPDWAAPAAEFAQFNQENADDVQLGSLFLLLAALELLWFAGYLRAELGRFEEVARGFTRVSHIAFAGGVVAAVGLALTAIVSVVAVSQTADTPPEIVRSLHQLSFAMFALASVGLIVLTSAAGLLILRTPVLPSWVGWVGLLVALFQFLTLFIALAPEDEDFVFGFAWFPGFLALLIWAVAASVGFLRRLGSPDESGAHPGARS
jgi:hypothetical protein